VFKDISRVRHSDCSSVALVTNKMIQAYSNSLNGDAGRKGPLGRLLALRAFILCSFVLYVFGFSPTPATIITVGLIVLSSSLFSLFSWYFRGKTKQAEIGTLMFQLLWDCMIILVFVSLVGRSTNPFIYYQLLIIAVSASILPEKYTWFFSALGISAYTALIYADLGHHVAHMDASFQSHIIGMWINFSGSALLISFFISRLSSMVRRQEEELRLAREENLKNEQLIGIGTLAASTVHSFGTPLSTITMTISELESLHKDGETRACTSVMQAQIERCKTTMKKLASLTTRESLIQQEISIADLGNEIKEYLYLVNTRPMPEIDIQPQLKNYALPGGILLIHAVINLIDNAVEAAKSHVAISFDRNFSDSQIRIIIEDDGDGILLEGPNTEEDKGSRGEHGLGIGLLLVNSTIERLGGTVSYRNSSDANPMTQVTVTLPWVTQELN